VHAPIGIELHLGAWIEVQVAIAILISQTMFASLVGCALLLSGAERAVLGHMPHLGWDFPYSPAHERSPANFTKQLEERQTIGAIRDHEYS
jgi:hypothetical protein